MNQYSGKSNKKQKLKVNNKFATYVKKLQVQKPNVIALDGPKTRTGDTLIAHDIITKETYFVVERNQKTAEIIRNKGFNVHHGDLYRYLTAIDGWREKIRNAAFLDFMGTWNGPYHPMSVIQLLSNHLTSEAVLGLTFACRNRRGNVRIGRQATTSQFETASVIVKSVFKLCGYRIKEEYKTMYYSGVHKMMFFCLYIKQQEPETSRLLCTRKRKKLHFHGFAGDQAVSLSQDHPLIRSRAKYIWINVKLTAKGLEQI